MQGQHFSSELLKILILRRKFCLRGTFEFWCIGRLQPILLKFHDRSYYRKYFFIRALWNRDFLFFHKRIDRLCSKIELIFQLLYKSHRLFLCLNDLCLLNQLIASDPLFIQTVRTCFILQLVFFSFVSHIQICKRQCRLWLPLKLPEKSLSFNWQSISAFINSHSSAVRAFRLLWDRQFWAVNKLILSLELLPIRLNLRISLYINSL